MKRGQITLFVILGIVVVAVIGLGLYFKGSILESSQVQVAERAVVDAEVQMIYDHIFDCVDETSKDGLNLIGLQGGYFDPPEDAIPMPGEGVSIAIGYDNGENKLPSLDTIKEELGGYVNVFLEDCVDLDLFENFAFEVELPKTDVEVLDNGVSFEVNYNIVAEKGENTYRLNQPYEFTYPIRLKKLYGISQDIVENEITDSAEIDINFLLEFGVDIEILSVEEGKIVYLITDEESMLNELPYIFMFGNRFEE